MGHADDFGLSTGRRFDDVLRHPPRPPLVRGLPPHVPIDLGSVSFPRLPDPRLPKVLPKKTLPRWAGGRTPWDDIVVWLPLGTALTRGELRVPVSPSRTPSDADVYENPDGTARMALPRYALAFDRVGTADEPRIAVGARDGVDTLLITLVRAPSPADGSGVGMLPHAVSVSLKYRLPVIEGGEVVHEVVFPTTTQNGATVTAELPLTAPGLREQLLAALASLSASASLTVGRGITVGVPTGTQAPNGEPGYEEQSLRLDCTVPPNPLVISTAQRDRLGGAGGAVAPFRRLRIPFGGRGHSYWQDPVWPHRFFFVPDRFRLARSATGPALRVRAADAANEADIKVTLEFFARAVTDPLRLEQARPALEQQARAGGSLLPVEVSVLPEAQPVLRLALPADGAPASSLTERPGALIDLELGLTHAETLRYDDFRLVYEALFGASLSLLRGEVRIGAGGDHAEDLPLELRLETMAGDALTLALDELRPDRIAATLTNATESPARIEWLSASALLGDREIPLRIDCLPPGHRLEPGGHLPVALVPAETLPEAGPDRIVLDQAGVVGEPDRQAVWNRVFDHTATPQLARSVQVEALPALFTASDRPTDRVAAFVVVVENGGTVRLTEAELKATTTVRVPIKPLLTGAPLPSLRYRTETWWQSGGVGVSAWRETPATILLPVKTAPQA
ncbi:hypothetical protein [Streptomyces phaeofaciens]|uniref:hypothetical protein n=1 Tax=Streptomyces phaeofaciens TaxID=68254 RepID=UPI0036D19BCC